MKIYHYLSQNSQGTTFQNKKKIIFYFNFVSPGSPGAAPVFRRPRCCAILPNFIITSPFTTPFKGLCKSTRRHLHVTLHEPDENLIQPEDILEQSSSLIDITDSLWRLDELPNLDLSIENLSSVINETLLVTIVNCLEIDSITMKYLTKGHTHMTADGVHGNIENNIKKQKYIYDFEDFKNCVRTSRKDTIVIEVTKEDILDWNKKKRNVRQKDENDSLRCFLLKDVVEVKFLRGERTLLYKKQFVEEYKVLDFLQKKYSVHELPTNNPPTTSRGIKTVKKHEIISNCLTAGEETIAIDYFLAEETNKDIRSCLITGGSHCRRELALTSFVAATRAIKLAQRYSLSAVSLAAARLERVERAVWVTNSQKKNFFKVFRKWKFLGRIVRIVTGLWLSSLRAGRDISQASFERRQLLSTYCYQTPSSQKHATRLLPQHAHYATPLYSHDCPTKLTPAHNYPHFILYNII
ncbi:hypothetical protein MSG28_010580 [Choristoneura fumiferana]|uniref:Uncharacterized protein n=1 Tax=Choristoneura fumiferana TaxID=7141 RepID=A0ACC0KMZ5_CHOFU|nr:hypothetical protein MSG28_010580 [Choristoneura fumiferana]